MTDEHGMPVSVTERAADMAAPFQVPAVVFDIDGVLCDSGQSIRDACAEAGSGAAVDWEQWCHGEFPAMEGYCELLHTLFMADVAIVLLTARQECSREPTEKWLADNNIPFDELLMRPDSEDYETWKTTALTALASSTYSVKVVLEDSAGHCAAIRALGIPVIHVQSPASQL